MRILHVTPYSPDAWAYGGIPRVVDALTRGLSRRGHRVTVCATDAFDASSRLDAGARTAGGVDLRVCPNLSNALAYRHQLFLPRGLRAYLRAHARDFDVAHLHACRNLPGALAATHLRRAGVPYVLAPNGTAPRLERQFLAKRVYDALIGRRLLRDAACVLAVTEAERRQLAALGVSADAIRVIPNPIDLDEFATPVPRGRLRAQLGLGAAPIVMFLGKLTPRKRVDVLVRAVARLARADAHLVIAGNDMGSGRELLQLAPALGVSARTHFTGLLRGRERLDALADADVVVYPSAHEIFGLVPLEALLVGTPVIVADDSGCGEVIASTGGGLVTPLGDVAALADAIDRILRAPSKWRATASDAAARVRQSYGSDIVCAAIERLYRDVLARPRVAVA
jgi:glycosyltransferase involved in cell wall biosynthesis